MDIDERVLVEEVARKRVVQTGSGREASDFIRRQQMRQRSEEQAAVPEPQVDFTKGVAAGSATQELEKELLKYLLKYGHRNFDFKEGRDVIQMNVADVILSTLDAQELHFQTEVYRKMLDTYREQRAELGEGVEVPAHLFINHPDPAVCNAAVDILTSDDNYVPSKLWEQKGGSCRERRGDSRAGCAEGGDPLQVECDQETDRRADAAFGFGATYRGGGVGGDDSHQYAQLRENQYLAQGAADDSLIRSMSITPGDGIRPIQTVSPSRTLMMPALKFRFE